MCIYFKITPNNYTKGACPIQPYFSFARWVKRLKKRAVIEIIIVLEQNAKGIPDERNERCYLSCGTG